MNPRPPQHNQEVMLEAERKDASPQPSERFQRAISVDGIVGAVRKAVGSGPVVERGQLLRVVGLGQWFAFAALLPLGYLLWRRNLG